MLSETSTEPPSPVLPSPAQSSRVGSAGAVSEVVRIRPPRRWEAFDFHALWRFRDLLVALAVRDIKLRYRQTALGVLWVAFQPLLAAGIFSFVFGRVAHLDSGGVPYVLFCYAGLLAWNLFSGIVLKASGSLVANAPLVAKVFFPRALLPFSSVVSSLLDFAIGLVVGVGLVLAYGSMPGWSLLMAPLWLLALLLLATGVGLCTAALAVAYRDVTYILPVGLQLLLYGSPVGYTIAAIPEGWPRLVYNLNPIAPLLEGFRGALLGHGFVDFRTGTYSVVFALVTFLGGLIVFKRMERQFADVI